MAPRSHMNSREEGSAAIGLVSSASHMLGSAHAILTQAHSVGADDGAGSSGGDQQSARMRATAEPGSRSVYATDRSRHEASHGEKQDLGQHNSGNGNLSYKVVKQEFGSTTANAGPKPVGYACVMFNYDRQEFVVYARLDRRLRRVFNEAAQKLGVQLAALRFLRPDGSRILYDDQADVRHLLAFCDDVATFTPDPALQRRMGEEIPAIEVDIAPEGLGGGDIVNKMLDG